MVDVIEKSRTQEQGNGIKKPYNATKKIMALAVKITVVKPPNSIAVLAKTRPYNTTKIATILATIKPLNTTIAIP